MERFRKKTVERGLMFLVCASLLMILSAQRKFGFPGGMEHVTALSDGWYYYEDEKRVDVTLPVLIRQEGEELCLYHDGLPEESAGQMLTTRGAVYRLKITAGEKELYQYEDESFPRNVQMASKVNCTVRLPEDMDEETIVFTYQNTTGGEYRIEEICMGSPVAVLLHQCAKDAFTLSIVFVLAILGVLTAGVSVYLKHMKVQEKRFTDIACFLLFCVCWFMTDSSLAQTLSGSSPVLRYISFYAFMLLAIPMLHFVKDTEGMQEYPVIRAVIYVFYLNAAIQGLLNYFGVFPFVDMLFVTHLLLLGGISVLVVILVREYRKNGSREFLTILQSFLVVAGGGVIALALYWLLRISYYEVFFECGIVVMILWLIRSLLVSVVQNFKFRTEAKVYQRLANEDMMTGMKNRRAFETLLDRIQEESDDGSDAYLIFMDVNGLKDINDRLGHSVGDEAIIAASRTIEKAFGRDGVCFRIGGDEFCAVLKNCGATQEELSARLDAELRQYNKNCSRYQLSVARGISSLRNQLGELRTVSDWKREADLKMYANKGWIRVRSEEK